MKVQFLRLKIHSLGGNWIHRFPVLASFAKAVLRVPATSVPCERLFSSSGYIVNKTRAALLPENVTSLVCLRDWLKL